MIIVVIIIILWWWWWWWWWCWCRSSAPFGWQWHIAILQRPRERRDCQVLGVVEWCWIDWWFILDDWSLIIDNWCSLIAVDCCRFDARCSNSVHLFCFLRRTSRVEAFWWGGWADGWATKVVKLESLPRVKTMKKHGFTYRIAGLPNTWSDNLKIIERQQKNPSIPKDQCFAKGSRCLLWVKKCLLPFGRPGPQKGNEKVFQPSTFRCKLGC